MSYSTSIDVILQCHAV